MATRRSGKSSGVFGAERKNAKNWRKIETYKCKPAKAFVGRIKCKVVLRFC